jgi:predicted acetyltransferase
VFSKDVTFTQDYRQFIKSMQFRLENHKNELLEKTKIYQETETEKISYLVRKEFFFSKILSNINFGIEFKKPSV